MSRSRNPASDTFSAADAAAVSAARAKPVVIRFDENTAFDRFELFGTADRIVLGTGHDEATPVDHNYFLELNNGEFAFNKKQLTIDARELTGEVDFDRNLFGEIVYVGTNTVTAYNVKLLGGSSSERFNSGLGSDTAYMGGGDDFMSIGRGNDTIYGGAGDDYVESLEGDFNALDTYHGGAGIDQITYYGQKLSDVHFTNVRSVEILGPSGPSDLELDTFAQRAGITTLFVDSFYLHTITVGAGFTGPLYVNHLGAVGPVLTFDASKSSSTITLEAGYNSTVGAPSYIGGSGAEDTILISNGYIYEGSPQYGGNLTNITGFEHVVVADLGGDSGAYLVLDTAKGEIASATQTVDASALGETKPFMLYASKATVAIDVLSGAGDDLLVTGSGRDRLEGGAGADILNGRGGRDVFAYSAITDSSGDAIDTIVNFKSGKDTVDTTGLGGSWSGAEIDFFGNQGNGAGADSAFAATAGDGVLDAVFRSESSTLWFDTDDNGVLDASDLHIVLTGVSALTGADVLSGQMVI